MAPWLSRTMALLALGVGLGYATNALRSDGVPLAGFDAPASCSGPPVEVAADAEECDPEPLESVAPEPDAPDRPWSVAP